MHLGDGAAQTIANSTFSRNEKNQILKCSFCEDEFTKESDLYQHKIAVHNETKNDDAQNIENSTKSKDNEKKKSLKCLFGLGGNNFCGAKFTLKSDLHEHKISAHNNDKKSFKCEICSAKFGQKTF